MVNREKYVLDHWALVAYACPVPAYYRERFSNFVTESPSSVFGKLAEQNAAHRFPLHPDQLEAWKAQLPSIAGALEPLLRVNSSAGQWTLLLEYPIPRIGTRIDAVILAGAAILVLEFKTGRSFGSASRQVEDYALSLANFHEGSSGRTIIPVVVNEFAATIGPSTASVGATGICRTNRSTLSGLGTFLEELVGQLGADSMPAIDAFEWDAAGFRPIPPIVEAAVALYTNKDIFEIGHACAANETLSRTTSTLVSAVRDAKENRKRTICFVTGVPGAGKTLVGLNAVHNEELKGCSTFLSGNGPLVEVLQEALIRDAMTREETRKAATLRVHTFIHNVHRFASNEFEREVPPTENVVVFDEAQRAWNVARNTKKYERPFSEPEMLMQIMERHPWAVIIALVGGGQEINDGEAGLEEWGRALLRHNTWQIAASPEVLQGGSSVAGFRLFQNPAEAADRTVQTRDLHLDVSMRSIRAKEVNSWVNAVLAGDQLKARDIAAKAKHLPYITRSLDDARNWLATNRIGFSRAGLVASAGAARLRADGLEPSFHFHKNFDWKNWFLDDFSDIRASSHLEVHATQFEIQGLELDWVGICWNEDLLWSGSEWDFYSFKNTVHKSGSHWVKRSKKKYQQKFEFLVNGYRVLLTRARMGAVIYVPTAHPKDPTRRAEDLDRTAKFLTDCGAKRLDMGMVARVAG